MVSIGPSEPYGEAAHGHLRFVMTATSGRGSAHNQGQRAMPGPIESTLTLDYQPHLAKEKTPPLALERPPVRREGDAPGMQPETPPSSP